MHESLCRKCIQYASISGIGSATAFDFQLQFPVVSNLTRSEERGMCSQLVCTVFVCVLFPERAVAEID